MSNMCGLYYSQYQMVFVEKERSFIKRNPAITTAARLPEMNATVKGTEHKVACERTWCSLEIRCSA
jgi:hypothetical protein